MQRRRGWDVCVRLVRRGGGQLRGGELGGGGLGRRARFGRTGLGVGRGGPRRGGGRLLVPQRLAPLTALLELRPDQRRREGLPQPAPRYRVLLPVDRALHVAAVRENGGVRRDGVRQGHRPGLHCVVDGLPESRWRGVGLGQLHRKRAQWRQRLSSRSRAGPLSTRRVRLSRRVSSGRC